jgi:hypothetical protein
MPRRFPQYRCTRNGMHLYRIEADDRFTELQRVGTRWLLHRVHAQAYPEKVRLAELLAGSEEVLEMPGDAFERAIARVAEGN